MAPSDSLDTTPNLTLPVHVQLPCLASRGRAAHALVEEGCTTMEGSKEVGYRTSHSRLIMSQCPFRKWPLQTLKTKVEWLIGMHHVQRQCSLREFTLGSPDVYLF